MPTGVIGLVVVVFGDRADAAEKEAQLRLLVVELPQRLDVERDAAALAHLVDDLDFGDAVLPVDVKVVLVELELVFAGMAIARAIGPVGDECVRGVLDDRGLERRVRVEERDDPPRPGIGILLVFQRHRRSPLRRLPPLRSRSTPRPCRPFRQRRPCPGCHQSAWCRCLLSPPAQRAQACRSRQSLHKQRLPLRAAGQLWMSSARTQNRPVGVLTAMVH